MALLSMVLTVAHMVVVVVDTAVVRVALPASIRLGSSQVASSFVVDTYAQKF